MTILIIKRDVWNLKCGIVFIWSMSGHYFLFLNDKLLNDLMPIFSL